MRRESSQKVDSVEGDPHLPRVRIIRRKIGAPYQAVRKGAATSYQLWTRKRAQNSTKRKGLKIERGLLLKKKRVGGGGALKPARKGNPSREQAEREKTATPGGTSPNIGRNFGWRFG